MQPQKGHRLLKAQTKLYRGTICLLDVHKTAGIGPVSQGIEISAFQQFPEEARREAVFLINRTQ